MKVLLDHSIVGVDREAFTFRKDRRFGGCRLCGELFQPEFNRTASEIQRAVAVERVFAADVEITQWRERHNQRHTASEHMALAESGLTFTPEAARRLAPYGLVPVGDADQPEIAQALLEAGRAPSDDVDTTLKGYITSPGLPDKEDTT